jgi:hypothetical protein
MTGDYAEMYKNDIGIVWGSSNWNSETYFFKIFPENVFSRS